MTGSVVAHILTGDECGEEIIAAVWAKGRIVPGVDPSQRRKDCCGAWIDRDQYGVTLENGTGWEIAHIPQVDGCDSDIGNLQPLQWENDRARRAARMGEWFCVREARLTDS